MIAEKVSGDLKSAVVDPDEEKAVSGAKDLMAHGVAPPDGF